MKEELHSWKEIADYFGVTTRTAQKWQKSQGLPVHRQPGERGRLLARTEELDALKLSGKHSNGATPSPDGAATSKRSNNRGFSR